MTYTKDSNVWVYDKDFADFFGMPAKGIEPVEGVTAAAFRVEEAPYQQCGLDGRADTCRKVELCYLDLYFDSRRHSLPWASDKPYVWYPSNGSLRWLRLPDQTQKPYGMASPDTPPGIIRTKDLSHPLVAFADPASKQEVIVTSNLGSSGDPEELTGALAVLGYARDFYKHFSVVMLQLPCASFENKTLSIRLDAKELMSDAPLAKFNQILLAEGIVQRIRDKMAVAIQPGVSPIPVYSTYAPLAGSDSQRYEINQAYKGATYFKDNHVWVYDKEFAELFGMPDKYIEPIKGIKATAFRIEETPYQECGFARREDSCAKNEMCYLDLYFDESKTPLPWATDEPYMWAARYSSMQWLRPWDITEKPYGMASPDTPPGVIRNKVFVGPLAPFADPTSKRQVIVTNNKNIPDRNPEARSSSMATLGYVREVYGTLSVLNVQIGCSSFSRKTINIGLDVRLEGLSPSIMQFNRVFLTKGFVQRMKDAIAIYNKRSTEFFRGLFVPPAATK